MNNYNYLIDLIGGVWTEEDGTQHLKVKDRPYDITFNPRVLEWTCNCPAYRYGRGKQCKHIKQIQKEIIITITIIKIIVNFLYFFLILI